MTSTRTRLTRLVALSLLAVAACTPNATGGPSNAPPSTGPSGSSGPSGSPSAAAACPVVETSGRLSVTVDLLGVSGLWDVVVQRGITMRRTKLYVYRTGLAREETTILDIAVPRVVVPLNPGKNITVISEVVAMMHLLRYSGVDVAAAFNARLIKRMKEQRGVREYLQEDYE